MKDLTLVPLGGLCNRLRALVSARCLLSYDPALRIQVVWATKAECAAQFDELFEENLTIAGRFVFRSADFLDAPAVLRRNLRLPALLRRLRYDGQYADFHSAGAPAECLAHFRATQRVYISTGSPLCSTPAAEWGVLILWKKYYRGAYSPHRQREKLARQSLVGFRAGDASRISRRPGSDFLLSHGR